MSRDFISSKKGTSTDTIVVLVAAIAIAAALLIGVTLFDKLNTSLSPTMGTRGNAVLAQMDHSLDVADTFFLLFWFGLSLGSIVSAFFVKTHPAFAGLAILFFLAALMLGPVFTNMYADLSTTDSFVTSTVRLEKTNFIMNNLYLFNAVFGMLLMMALYISFRSGD